MESSENIVRVKHEPNDTWTDAGDDYILDSVDSVFGEAGNIETFPFYETPVSFKDVKTELKSLATTTSQTEYQHFQLIVKKEYKNEVDDVNENIFIDFECKNLKVEQTPPSPTICKTECQSEHSNQINDFKGNHVRKENVLN
ncbi:hypothetical protein TKK_0007505 [Trichogramma kaykai]